MGQHCDDCCCRYYYYYYSSSSCCCCYDYYYYYHYYYYYCYCYYYYYYPLEKGAKGRRDQRTKAPQPAEKGPRGANSHTFHLPS